MEKEVYSVKDLQQILGGVSYSTATRKMREVKAFSDRLEIRGHIHRLDWDDFLNRFAKKEGA